MILFEKDFREQGAVVDTYTNNVFFVRLSRLLRNMGVANNKFMLSLYDTDLMGRDPHNLDDPSVELRMRIAQEAAVNYWYFIRECIRIPVQGSMESGYFMADRANIALAWVFHNNIDPYLTMPRQLGKTFAAKSIAGHQQYVAGRRINIGLFAKDHDLVQENVTRLKMIRDSLPEYMLDKRPVDTENKEGLSYTALENQYKTFVPQSSQVAASRHGKGESFIWLHWDELPFFTNNKYTWSAAFSSTSTAQPNARASGLRCANIITTTAGMLDNMEGIFAYDIKRRAMRFSEKMYDETDENSLKQLVEDNSDNGKLYLEFTYKQLGKDEQWLEERRREVDPITFAMDYLNQWMHGTGQQILPQNVLDQLHNNREDPVTTSMFQSLLLRWYKDPEQIDRNLPIVFGCDTSDNVGDDFTTLVGVDPTDMSTLVSVRCNVTNLTYVAQCIIKMLERYPRSIFVPERNKNGAFLIDLILVMLKDSDKNVNPWTRIFNTVIQNWDTREERVNLQHEDPTNTTWKKYFGFWTSGGGAGGGSRKFLYKNVLMTDIPRNVERIYDGDIIDEVNALTVRNGRVDHPAGQHDDTLVARLLASYFIMFGRNISMYGVEPSEMLSSVDNDGDNIDPEEKRQQHEYKERIKELDELVDDPSIPEAVKREHRVERNRLKRLIDEDEDIDDSNISLSQITEEEKTKKKKRSAAYRWLSSPEGRSMLSKFV